MNLVQKISESIVGRRKDHSRQELAELAIDSAYRIVAGDGYGALTARRVAADMGYAVGTIYNVFEDLGELDLHVKARVLDRLHDRILALPPADSPEEAVTALIRTYYAFVQEHSRLWESVFERRDSGGMALPDWYLAHIEKPFTVVEAALRPLFTEADTAQAGRVARTLWAGVHGVTELARRNLLGLVSDEDGVEMACDLALRYLEGLRAGD